MIEAREIKPNSIRIKIEDEHMTRDVTLVLPESIDTDTILRNIGVSLLNMVDASTDEVDSNMILNAVDNIAIMLNEY